VAWLSGSRDPAGGARPPDLRCPALKELLGSLRPGARHTVLDLGPPLAANLQFLSALSCRVRIADLHRSLSVESVESRRPEAMGALLDRLLPLAPGERFDALLAWDVFDYMRTDQVSALMRRLAPACPPETPALVLASTGRTIPARPLRYRILDPESLLCEGSPEPTRAGPRYTQPDFRRMMAGFSIRRSVLLRSGLHEYLFVRDAGEEPVKAVEAGAPRGAASRAPWFRRGPV
jgi:hypothetical protein